jgi:saccharopine dehydrogenase-like NADP-dependent oxidoreductase
MSKKKIVIGSNGILGKIIVEKATKTFGVANIVLADYKVKRLAFQKEQIGTQYGIKPLTRIVNIHSSQSVVNGLKDIELVIIAIQQHEPLIQKYCIERGISSIDVSVNPQFLEKVLSLNASIEKNSVQIITGGLFPGLSGILAKQIAGDSPQDEIVDVGLLQSANGTNGKTGVSDMLKIFDKKVELIKGDAVVKYSGFFHKKSFDFPKPFGIRKLRLANFVERDYLKSKGIISNYWTAFDREIINKYISTLRKIGSLKLMNNQKIKSILSSSVTKQKKNIKDETIGLIAKNSEKGIALVLTSDYEATASCVVAFTKLILRDEMNISGVRFPFELFSFEDLKSEINDVIIDMKNT